MQFCNILHLVFACDNELNEFTVDRRKAVDRSMDSQPEMQWNYPKLDMEEEKEVDKHNTTDKRISVKYIYVNDAKCS